MHNHREKLLELGITESLLSIIDNEALDVKKLYNNLRIIHMRTLPTQVFKIESPWQLYALSGNVTHYQKLLDQPEQKDYNGCGIAYYLVVSGSDALDWLQTNAPALLNTKDPNGASLVHWAVRFNKLSALEWLRNNQPLLINEKTRQGASLAHLASSSGLTPILDWVLNYYPEQLWGRNIHGETLLHYAARHGLTAIFDWVETHHLELFDTSDNSGATWVHTAASKGKTNILDFAKHNYPQLLREKNQDGNTLLHYAAAYGQKATFDWVNANCDELFEERNNKNASWVHTAAIQNHTIILNWAINNKPAQLEDRGIYNSTLVHHAAMYGHSAILDWVRDNCRKLLKSRDVKNATLIDYAIANNQITILDWVKENQIKLLFMANNEGTWIHRAARLSKEVLNWAYLNQPAILTTKDPNGALPIHIAAKQGFPDCLNRLLAFSCLNELDFTKVVLDDNELITSLQTVATALDSNFSITSLVINKAQQTIIPTPLQEELQKKILRNKIIKETQKEFTIFLLTNRNQNGPPNGLNNLPLELLGAIFSSLLDTKFNDAKLDPINDKKKQDFFKQSVKYSVDIAVGTSVNYKIEASDLINKEIKRLKNASKTARFVPWLKSGNEKIAALTHLKSLVKNGNASAIQHWETQHQTTIDQQRNRLHAFFRPAHTTKTRLLVNKINAHLNINNDDQPITTDTLAL